MSTHNIHGSNTIYLNICFLWLSREFTSGLKNEFELAMVNEPSVLESLRFYCIWFH